MAGGGAGRVSKLSTKTGQGQLEGPRGAISSNTYDSRGNLTKFTDALGHITVFAYTGGGDLASLTDGLGQRTTYTYDRRGQETSSTNPLGHTTSWIYDAMGNVVREETERTVLEGTVQSLVTTYAYDAIDRQIATTAPDGATTTTTYGAVAHVDATTDPLGYTTRFVYDEMGRQVEMIAADGTVDRSEYDATDRLIASVDALGRRTTYAYDAAGRLLSTTRPDGATSANGYDSAGRLTASTDANGNKTTFVYDSAGRRTQTIDPLGYATSFTYDPAGAVIETKDALGNVTKTVYDLLGRPTKQIDALEHERLTAYDALGRTIRETNELGHSTLYAHDALGRLVSVTDALGHETSYGYDELGNFVRLTDANGHTTRFGYDEVGRQIARILPDGATERHVYDAAGRMIERVGFDGQSIVHRYDSMGREIERILPDGPGYRITYTPTGRRATVTDARGVTAYAYDAQDRLARLTYPNGRALVYGHDDVGNRTSLEAVLPDRTLETVYSYDARNQVSMITDHSGRTYEQLHDELGRRAELAYPNGVKSTWRYNARHETIEIAHTSQEDVLARFLYEIDPAGRRTSVQELSGLTRLWEYDAINQLAKEKTLGTGEDSTYSFAFDPVGNRISDSSPDRSVSYTYDSRDRRISVGGNSIDWDPNGQALAFPEGPELRWTSEGRLNSLVEASGEVLRTEYDLDGLRVSTHTGDYSSEIMTASAEGSGGGLKPESFEYFAEGDEGLRLVLARGVSFLESVDGTEYAHGDHLGSIRLISDRLGKAVHRFDYGPFGSAPSPSSGSFFQGPFGEPHLSSYEISYLRERWLSTRDGMFLSPDSWSGTRRPGYRGSLYAYAGNDPVNTVDPSGLFGISVVELSLAGGIRTTLSGVQADVGLAVLTSVDEGPRAAIFQLLGAAALGAAAGALLPRVARLWSSIRSRSLLKELKRQSVKHTPSRVIAIDKLGGRVVFLEIGNSKAGLEHILIKHEAHFAAKGISVGEIPELVFQALRNGRKVGERKGGEIFDVMFKGKSHRVLVVVSDNGFVVTAHPIGRLSL